MSNNRGTQLTMCSTVAAAEWDSLLCPLPPGSHLEEPYQEAPHVLCRALVAYHSVRGGLRVGETDKTVVCVCQRFMDTVTETRIHEKGSRVIKQYRTNSTVRYSTVPHK